MSFWLSFLFINIIILFIITSWIQLVLPICQSCDHRQPTSIQPHKISGVFPPFICHLLPTVPPSVGLSIHAQILNGLILYSFFPANQIVLTTFIRVQKSAFYSSPPHLSTLYVFYPFFRDVSSVSHRGRLM